MSPEIERLVESLLPQARSEAWRCFQSAPQQLELDELVSLANVGLAQAAARWETYCADHGYDPAAVQYFPPYALRRMRGAMLDYMRSVDWVTRSVRGRAKRLRDAGADTGATEAQLAEATGLTTAQIRETAAAVARRPVSMDAEPVDVAEDHDVEGAAAVAAVLDAVVTALAAQPWKVQTVVALRYHQAMDLREIAATLQLTEAEVSEAHAIGILAVHEAMVRAASDTS